MKHSKREIFRARDVANNIVETVSNNLFGTNLIQECPPSSLPNFKYSMKH